MYNTSINIIAGIPNIKLIYDVVREYSLGKSKADIKQWINQSSYGIRTSQSRERFLRAIYDSFLVFHSEEQKQLFTRVLELPNLHQTKQTALMLQLAVNNDLFYQLTSHTFLRLFQDGRLMVDKVEFLAYLEELNANQNDKRFSKITMDTIVSKYLTWMTKLDFLKGKVKKEFCRITPNDSTIIYALYFIASVEKHEGLILKSKYTPLLMISQKNLVERVKKIALEDFFIVSSVGDDVRIELKYQYEEVVDAIREKH